jgi:importin-7
MESSKLQEYLDALENTGCSDNDKRKHAEVYIQESKKHPGFCQAMMQIASNSEYAQNRSFDVNLAAAIQLKNMADYHWKYSSEEKIHTLDELEDSDNDNEEPAIYISQEDKDFVKLNIIQTLAHAPSFGVLAQFEEIIYTVAKYELPDNWPSAIIEITELLNEAEEVKVFAGLIALKEIVHKFEFEFKERRKPLQELVDNIFPRIEEILLSLIEADSEDAVRAKNIITETFYLANQVKLCNRYHNIDKFDSLMGLIIKALTQELPSGFTQQTEDTEQILKLEKSNQWKLKKNCIMLINKLFNQLSDTEMVEESDVKISKHFVDNHAKNVLDICLLIIKTSLDHYVTNGLVSFAIRIISKTEKVDYLFAHIMPHIEEILFKYCLPLLRLTPTEVEEFNENPVSYIRAQFDISDTLNSTKNSAIDLMNYLATYKENEENKEIQPIYLCKFVHHLYDGLNECQTNRDDKQKESIMLALGHLNKHIQAVPDLHKGVEFILKEHIFPELYGENEFLKARALWCYGELSLFVQEPEHAVSAVEHVYKCLLDD